MTTPDLQVTALKPGQDQFGRVYVFSCDFCKKETWYINSLSKEDNFSGDAVTTEFQLTEGSGSINTYSRIIDLSHGKITDEGLIAPPSGQVRGQQPGGYVPVVKIDNIVQTEREKYEAVGGDYEIDYTAGKLKFFTAPGLGAAINISYYYSPNGSGPIIEAQPPAGKKWIISVAEVQFSSDVEITDSFMSNVFINHPIYGPNIPVGPDSEYSNAGNFMDYTYGSFPVCKAFGGPTRGLQKDIYILRWDYAPTLELSSSLEAKLKVWTKHGRGYGGERATVTLYGIEEGE